MIGKIVFRMVLSSALLFVFSLGAIGILLYNLHKHILNRGWKIVLLIVAIIGILYIVLEVTVFALEIQNDIYIEYEGRYEYTHMPEYSILGANGHRVILSDENSHIVVSPCQHLDDGIYEGHIVYTRWSKWIIYIEGTPV